MHYRECLRPDESMESGSSPSVSRFSPPPRRRRRYSVFCTLMRDSTTTATGFIASDIMIETNPGLVRRFVAATLEGLKSAMADPKEAGEIMHKYHREIDVDIAIGETRKVMELATQPNPASGALDPEPLHKP